MKKAKYLVILLILISLTTVISAENGDASRIKAELDARYIFDLNHNDRFSERLAAVDYLAVAKRFDVLIRALEDATDGRIRNAILLKLGQLQNRAYLEMFIRYLDPRLVSFWETRYIAVGALENYADPALVPYLLQTAETDPYWEVKARAAAAIVKIGSEQDVGKVIEIYLREENLEAQYQLMLALCCVDNPITTAALFDSWQHKDQRFVTAISYVMGVRNYQDAFYILQDKLAAADKEERAAAFFALSLYAQTDPEITSDMLAALEDSDEEIRKLAIFYLAVKNEGESIFKLQEMAESPLETEAVKELCYLALKELGVIGHIDSIKDKQLIVNVGRKFDLKQQMAGQVLRVNPYLDAGSWPISTLNSTQAVLTGQAEILAAISEDKENYQVIFLFPPGNYLTQIYEKLNLPPWVRKIMEKKYAFAP